MKKWRWFEEANGTWECWEEAGGVRSASLHELPLEPCRPAPDQHIPTQSNALDAVQVWCQTNSLSIYFYSYELHHEAGIGPASECARSCMA